MPRSSIVASAWLARLGNDETSPKKCCTPVQQLNSLDNELRTTTPTRPNQTMAATEGTLPFLPGHSFKDAQVRLTTSLHAPLSCSVSAAALCIVFCRRTKNWELVVSSFLHTQYPTVAQPIHCEVRHAPLSTRHLPSTQRCGVALFCRARSSYCHFIFYTQCTLPLRSVSVAAPWERADVVQQRRAGNLQVCFAFVNEGLNAPSVSLTTSI